MADQMMSEPKPGIAGPGLDYPKIAAMVSQLASAIAQSKAPSRDSEAVSLRADYQITVDVIKLLSDIRFRCLVFVTAIITVATALLPGTGESGTRIMLGFVGLVATLGITIYELRNSQLYEAAIHRAKTLETRLDMDSTTECGQKGLFNERPLYVKDKYWKALPCDERTRLIADKNVTFMRFWLVKVKHDHGLACIYGAVLGGWVYQITDGLLSLPPPGGLWLPAPAGWPRIISALVAFLAFVVSVGRFAYHDQNRYRPGRPKKKTGPGLH